MTDVTPSTVRYEVHAWIAAERSPTGDAYALPIRRDIDGAVRISEDQDRDNFGEVRLELDWVDEAIWTALDPRTQTIGFNAYGPILVRVDEFADAADTWPVRSWPGNYDDPGVPNRGTDGLLPGRLWIMDADRDYVARTVTLTLATGEAILDQALRIVATVGSTGATTVAALQEWALAAVFGSGVVPFPTVSGAIPVGTRRDMQPGDSFLGLLKPELDALGGRLYDFHGNRWFSQDRDTVIGDQFRLATAPGLSVNSDPIVYELRETKSRRGLWADGILMRFDQTPIGGTVTWQASTGGGSSTKGRIVDSLRPAPSAGAADKVKSRSLIRGRDLEVTARARLDARPRRSFAVTTPVGALTGQLRAVEFSFPEGTMTLRVQS